MSDDLQDLSGRVARLETRLDQRLAAQDESYLDILPLLHYLVAGVTFLIGCFPLIHVAVGLGIVLATPAGPNPPPVWLGWLFAGIGAGVVLFFWCLSVLWIVAGRCIAARRRWTLCVVAATAGLLVMPFGTALGIFSLIVLTREPVKRAFGASGAGPA